MLVMLRGSAGQEDDRQLYAFAAQARQQVDPRDRRQAPVKHDHVGGRAVGDRGEHALAVGEALDCEAEVGQFARRGLAKVVVVVDQDEADAVVGAVNPSLAGRGT
jgi:hypothetical protein